MTIVIFILFGLAMWHFVVESIVVPSARAALRLRLFALRDELRNLLVKGEAGEEEFDEAQRIVNNVIRLAPTFDAFGLEQWRRTLKANPEMAERIERRKRHFESVASQPVMNVIDRAYRVGITSLGFNSLGWLIYFVPALMVALVWKSITRNVVRIATATEHELMPLQPCQA